MKFDPIKFKTYVRQRHDEARKAIEAWEKKLANDPVYALEWSTSAFQAAGVLAVTRSLIHAMEKPGGEWEEGVRSYLLRELRICARNPERSTSVESNSVDRWKLAALGDLAEKLEGGWL